MGLHSGIQWQISHLTDSQLNSNHHHMFRVALASLNAKPRSASKSTSSRFLTFSSFSLQSRPLTLFFSFWYPNTVSSYSEKGLCDDTFLKPFFCALLSEKNAFGPSKASKMSKRFLQFQTRHQISLHPVLQLLLMVSLATFLTDQLISAQTVSEILPRVCTSKCTQKHHKTTNFFRASRVKNFKKNWSKFVMKTNTKKQWSLCKEKLEKR